jgi:SAM-dependent methyltransferase
MTQRWKTDKNLYACPTKKNGMQVNKELDYDTTYRKEFLECDPLQDWPSIDRCIWLWQWAIEQINENNLNWSVLDVGTKDAQFPEWLRTHGIMAIGLEYSEPYVKYAINKGRPVKYGNACDMDFDDGMFDFVFSHHLHGLLPDYAKGLEEMMRVSKKYMICLNQVPGNKRKHFSYIDSPQIYHNFAKFGQHTVGPFEVIYNDYLDTGHGDEWVFFAKKTQYESIERSIERIDEEVEEIEPEFKKKKRI